MTNEQPVILSLETSGKVCSVALMNGRNTLFQENIQEANMHDKMLAQMVDKAMSKLDKDYSMLDAVAVSAGPGSFTGLRIGAALAKGITFDSDIKLISIPTMDAIAYDIINHNDIEYDKIIILIPSHKNLFYYAVFDSSCNKTDDIQLIKKEELNKLADKNTIFAGPEIEQLSGILTINTAMKLNAGIIANYAYKLYFENEFVNANEFVPLYVQDFKPKTRSSDL